MVDRFPNFDYPTVSIVTPSFNQGEFIEQTILSILNQSYTKIEYIMIDGESKDNTLDIISQYREKISYFISEPDNGQSHAINKGLKISRGEIVGWLNSDDILLPNSIESIVREFINDLSVGVVYGHNLRMNRNGKIIPTPLLEKDRLNFGIDYILHDPLVNQPGSFWRRTIMNKAGWLDETLSFAMDYEYWIRLAILGIKFKRLDRSLAIYRLNPNSKTSTKSSEMAFEQVRVLEDLQKYNDFADLLGENQIEIQKKINKVKANAFLKASYGKLKQKKIIDSIKWFTKAISLDPTVIFQDKWKSLLISKINRSRYYWFTTL